MPFLYSDVKNIWNKTCQSPNQIAVSTTNFYSHRHLWFINFDILKFCTQLNSFVSIFALAPCEPSLYTLSCLLACRSIDLQWNDEDDFCSHDRQSVICKLILFQMIPKCIFSTWTLRVLLFLLVLCVYVRK